jgi:hypothetical protein
VDSGTIGSSVHASTLPVVRTHACRLLVGGIGKLLFLGGGGGGKRGYDSADVLGVCDGCDGGMKRWCGPRACTSSEERSLVLNGAVRKEGVWNGVHKIDQGPRDCHAEAGATPRANELSLPAIPNLRTTLPCPRPAGSFLGGWPYFTGHAMRAPRDQLSTYFKYVCDMMASPALNLIILFLVAPLHLPWAPSE